MFNGTNLTHSSDVDHDTYKKGTKHKKTSQESQEISSLPAGGHNATRNRQDSATKTKTNH